MSASQGRPFRCRRPRSLSIASCAALNDVNVLPDPVVCHTYPPASIVPSLNSVWTRKALTALPAVVLPAVLLIACTTTKSDTTMAAGMAASGMPANAMAGHNMGAAPMAGHDMAGMSGMDAPVKIPPGVLYTAADVHFMQGMIAHHAQAIYMSKLAYKNSTNPRVKFLSTKIDQSQRVEIVLMQNWLLDNGQTAPDTLSYKTMMMTGMLTPAQLVELENARDVDFDRKFLTFMIMHHEGAISMVKDLFATPLSGQETNINVFANDVEQVQTAEISAMKQMLADLR